MSILNVKNLYLEQTDESDLKEALGEFMKVKVLVMRIKDFQLSIESYQFKLNLTKPQLTMPGIKALELYTTIEEPMFGIIYDNDKFEKRFMAFDEINKFLTGTLERDSSRICQKLEDNNMEKIEPKLAREEVANLGRMEVAILSCMYTREQMKMIESYVGARNLH
ncbi:hypothetical protein Tco_0704631 [Tanacetum coccineum]|uniref:Uncharacterized protein n=1 Tax=Tanacetum coccineum TaxID=301880 RepID=A0ABQ4Y2A0_9ASTR